jgi:multicomponent Na+:H+ antiporter subunit D
MADLILPPGLILILAGLLLPLIPRTVGNLLLLAAPLGALALVWSVPDGVSLTAPFLGLTLEFVQADDLARLFGTVFCIAAFGGGLYAMTQHSTRELACAFIYAGSALGVVFAGDLVTVFIFWEIMAVTSTVIVWCGGASARNAGLRYAAIHFLGGVLLMAGIAGELAINGSTDFAAMDLSNAARWMIFAGFLINAGAPPFSPWVPDAYPAASWSGAVFLSAFTTKTAVYVLIRGFPGTEILIFIGLFMIFYGIIYAILENDMRRVLVYSIVNQIGFMLVAIGIGTELALNGAAAHAFTHIIYKATLLMSAGAVMQAVGTSKMSELGGLYKSMPLTAICGLVGAMAISALPFTSGYVSKSLLTGAASEAHHALAWYGLTAASAAAFLYVGLRYPWFTFFDGSKADKSGQDPHITMKLAMVLFAFLCVIFGLAPGLLFGMLPDPVTYKLYGPEKIVLQLQLLLFAGFSFFATLAMHRPTATTTLDIDWLWRRLGWSFIRGLDRTVLAIWQSVLDILASLIGRIIERVYAYLGPAGPLARTWPTGLMTFWTTVLLGAVLILAYI